MTPEVLITKEMEEEERQLMEEGERKEKELIEKVCFYPRKKKLSLFSFITSPAWKDNVDIIMRDSCLTLQARKSLERDSHDMRFKRLQHLLQKSNIYSKFLLTKMEQQQAEVLCLYMYVFVTEFVFFFSPLQIRVFFPVL